MQSAKKVGWQVFILAVALTLFFALLYYTDNKYQTLPPYGRSGVIVLKEKDLNRHQPLFLVSGWLLTDARVENQSTYIGEFSNLQRGEGTVSPHGMATYCLTLRYSGNPVDISISFPQLFSQRIISLDGRMLSQGSGGARVSFTMSEGDHLLTVQTTSQQGYYSGMYHPPALGTTETILAAALVQGIAYGVAFFVPLVLALFMLALWRLARDRVVFWFSLVCSCFSLYVSYYFVRLLHLPFESYWFLVQSAAFYGLCFCVVRLTMLVAGNVQSKINLWIQAILIVSPLVLLLLAFLIPAATWAGWLHGILTDLYYIFTFCTLLFLSLRDGLGQGAEYRWTCLGCTAFGGGLLLNLFFSNRFEPILLFWQFEWCGLFLVALFGCMMVARNKRILSENQAFSENLETMVEQRTEELLRLLRERKTFFAEMAHGLKAPIFATKAFIQAIRENDTCVDGELLHYIDQVEQKQQEMAHRIQSLTTLNEFDSIATEEMKHVSIRNLLNGAYTAHHMAAEVASVHLIIEQPEGDGMIFAQPKKLENLLENLIYNALRATPPDGKITLSAELQEGVVHITVADTGCGIPTQELPHIFERFYIGQQNKGSGSGLGLYIVKSIVDELGGEILASSKPNQGTAFFIDLPCE